MVTQGVWCCLGSPKVNDLTQFMLHWIKDEWVGEVCGLKWDIDYGYERSFGGWLLIVWYESHRWVSARKTKLQCVSNGVTSFLHLLINILTAWCKTVNGLECVCVKSGERCINAFRQGVVNIWGPFGLTLFLVWISNYISYKLWHEIIYPFPNL